MVYSAEIRWFFVAEAEVAILQEWFKSYKQFFTGNWSRADYYLWQPNIKTTGVKLREGKLEIKILLAGQKELPIGSINSGITNNWVKYSFNLPDSDEESNKLLAQFSSQPVSTRDDCWVRVDKERLLVKFSLENSELKNIAPDAWPDEGCGLELTKIKVNQKTYYTFGLEAFSKTRLQEHVLHRVINEIMPAIKVTNLQVPHSQAYPEFLASLYPV